jgi:hypothetical protein
LREPCLYGGDLFEQAARAPQARQRAAVIATRAVALSTADKDIASKIGTVTTDLADREFAETYLRGALIAGQWSAIVSRRTSSRYRPS